MADLVFIVSRTEPKQYLYLKPVFADATRDVVLDLRSGLRVRLATAPVHAVLVGTVVPFAPRHDDACAFGQGSNLCRRERRIIRLRFRHSNCSITGTPRARAKRSRLFTRRGAATRR